MIVFKFCPDHIMYGPLKNQNIKCNTSCYHQVAVLAWRLMITWLHSGWNWDHGWVVWSRLDDISLTVILPLGNRWRYDNEQICLYCHVLDRSDKKPSNFVPDCIIYGKHLMP